MNIHLGLALALILAGVLLVGLSLSDGGPRSAREPATHSPAQVEAVAAVGGAGQG